MRDLVLQKNELMELEEDVNRIKKQYEFFDEHNEREAREFCEGVLHSIYAQSSRQACLQGRELANLVNYDRALKVIDLLKQIDIEAKPFCFHPSEQDEQFIVRSRNLDWMVATLSSSDELIPTEFMRGLTHLKRNGLKADVAIATPAEQKPLSRIIGEVLKDELRKTGRVARAFCKLIADFSTGVSDRMHDLAVERQRRIAEMPKPLSLPARQSVSINPVTSLPETSTSVMGRIVAEFYRMFPLLKDPILLVKIGPYFIECGRWL